MNHPSSSSEWVRHEINGVPNIRYSIWIGDFNGEDSHKIKKEPLTYVANGVKVVEYGYNKQFLNSNELRIDLFNTLQSIYNLTSISESKQIIRLTETDLHEIIKDAVKYIIREQDSHVDKVIGNYNVIDGGWWDGLPHGLESKGTVPS